MFLFKGAMHFQKGEIYIYIYTYNLISQKKAKCHICNHFQVYIKTVVTDDH